MNHTPEPRQPDRAARERSRAAHPAGAELPTHPDPTVRKAVAATTTDPTVRRRLLDDPDPAVRVAALTNPLSVRHRHLAPVLVLRQRLPN